MDMSVSEGEEEPEADSHGSPRNRKFLLTPSKKKKKRFCSDVRDVGRQLERQPQGFELKHLKQHLSKTA